MEDDGHPSYAMMLAQRGLSTHSFDGRVLRLIHTASADPYFHQGRPVSDAEVTAFARNVLAPLLEKDGLFAGLERIEVRDRF